MWYRDFPLQRSLREKAQPADWTTHIGIAVRSTADLLGLFTHFESGARTDAVLRDSKGAIAILEWEWKALHRGDAIITEFKKLKDRCARDDLSGVRFAGLIGYARQTSARARDDYTMLSASVLEGYTERWEKQLPPLLLVMIHFKGIQKDESRQRRQFEDMEFYGIEGGSRVLLRKQKAFPWDVSGSRWAKETENAS
jgi:hypothetical protein